MKYYRQGGRQAGRDLNCSMLLLPGCMREYVDIHHADCLLLVAVSSHSSRCWRCVQRKKQNNLVSYLSSLHTCFLFMCCHCVCSFLDPVQCSSLQGFQQACKLEQTLSNVAMCDLQGWAVALFHSIQLLLILCSSFLQNKCTLQGSVKAH